MKTVRGLLHDADPLRHEPPISSQRRDASRAAVVSATTAIPARAGTGRPPFRFARFAMISIVLLGIIFLGSRLWPRMGFETHARVRFEVRLAETVPGPELRESTVSGSGAPIYLHDEVILDNDDVASAEISKDPGGRYAVMVRFTPAGADKVRTATQDHLGKPLAILIDDVVVMAPTLRSALGDSAMITWFSEEQADRIANGMK